MYAFYLIMFVHDLRERNHAEFVGIGIYHNLGNAL